MNQRDHLSLDHSQAYIPGVEILSSGFNVYFLISALSSIKRLPIDCETFHSHKCYKCIPHGDKMRWQNASEPPPQCVMSNVYWCVHGVISCIYGGSLRVPGCQFSIIYTQWYKSHMYIYIYMYINCSCMHIYNNHVRGFFIKSSKKTWQDQ